MACEICSRLTHEWYDCPKKPDGYVPLARRERQKLGAKDRGDHAEPVSVSEGTPMQDQSLPHPAPLTKRGTPRQRAPKGTFDRKAWQRDYQARQRAKKKAKS